MKVNNDILNIILNYAVEKEIYLETYSIIENNPITKKSYILTQVNLLNEYGIDFAFTLGLDNDDMVSYSILFEMNSSYSDKVEEIRDDFYSIENRIFNDFIMEEVNNVLEINIIGELDVSLFDETTIDQILEFINSEYVLNLNTLCKK